MNANPTYQPDSRLDLQFERIIDVPKELVWKAWTSPEHLMPWFCPLPWTTIDCEIDLRPGGIFRTVMRSPEGQEFPNVGCYLEVIENKNWSGRMHSPPVSAPPLRPAMLKRVESFSSPLRLHCVPTPTAQNTPQQLSTRMRRIAKNMRQWGFTMAGERHSTNWLHLPGKCSWITAVGSAMEKRPSKNRPLIMDPLPGLRTVYRRRNYRNRPSQPVLPSQALHRRMMRPACSPPPRNCRCQTTCRPAWSFR